MLIASSEDDQGEGEKWTLNKDHDDRWIEIALFESVEKKCPWNKKNKF